MLHLYNCKEAINLDVFESFINYKPFNLFNLQRLGLIVIQTDALIDDVLIIQDMMYTEEESIKHHEDEIKASSMFGSSLIRKTFKQRITPLGEALVEAVTLL